MFFYLFLICNSKIVKCLLLKAVWFISDSKERGIWMVSLAYWFLAFLGSKLTGNPGDNFKHLLPTCPTVAASPLLLHYPPLKTWHFLILTPHFSVKVVSRPDGNHVTSHWVDSFFNAKQTQCQLPSKNEKPSSWLSTAVNNIGVQTLASSSKPLRKFPSDNNRVKGQRN